MEIYVSPKESKNTINYNWIPIYYTSFSYFVFTCFDFVFLSQNLNIINFVDVEYSRRVNPIQAKYINNLAAASETAETLLESLQKGKKEGGGGSDQFFQTSAVNFLAACIYFFVNYEREPYDAKGNKLYAEKRQDPETKFWKPTGVVRAKEGGEIVEPAYWLGKYSDMPHILSFLNESYQTCLLYTSPSPRDTR